MSRLLILDTNTASYIIKGTSPLVLANLQRTTPDRLVVSALTEGELLFGARKIGATRLEIGIRAFLQIVGVLTWDAKAAECYADLRVRQEKAGKPLSALDTLIAAHALSVDATLVTADRALKGIPNLLVEDWTQP